MKISALIILFSIKNSYYYSMTKNINGILQINGSYSVLQYNKSYDTLRYGTKARRKVKYSYHKKGLIEDHHLIPKEFNKHHLFDNINFDIGENEIIGLLGPNGCGKTTTIAMMLGLLKPTNGKVLIDGEDIEKKRISLLHKMNFISPYIESVSYTHLTLPTKA